jgi:nucleoside 2-deoxyribosyltransferase
MKIYFAGSIRGGRDRVELYHQLIVYLGKYGTVLTEHIGNPNITSNGENLDKKEIFDRDVRWMDESDVVIAEVTTNSLGVGYELGRADELGKPVLCLYCIENGDNLSAMIGGNMAFKVSDYTDIESAFRAIDGFFAGLPS